MNQTAQNIQSLSPCPGTPNCVCSAYPDSKEFISPISYEGDSVAALNRIQEVIKGMTRTRVVTATNRYIHAEFTSLIFRFVDDVEILIEPEENVMHIRSASRVGRSDLGANRKRVEQIRALFEKG
ncbi:MAG: DUF1499 domain-containing protein [Acidiferrobacterales bacterium]|nr:DUF1499 domain-containing protein [Acidiferrobacterales bacterium]